MSDVYLVHLGDDRVALVRDPASGYQQVGSWIGPDSDPLPIIRASHFARHKLPYRYIVQSLEEPASCSQA